MFSTGVSHFWLDIQWYLHQALTKAVAKDRVRLRKSVKPTKKTYEKIAR